MIPHWLTDATGILTPIVALVWAAIKLAGKNQIRDATDTIVTEVNKIGSKIDTHIASDEQKHLAIDGHLQATDGRVTRIENKVWL